jgi:hypothetical protein
MTSQVSKYIIIEKHLILISDIRKKKLAKCPPKDKFYQTFNNSEFPSFQFPQPQLNNINFNVVTSLQRKQKKALLLSTISQKRNESHFNVISEYNFLLPSISFTHNHP